jgi:hypothetical protein
VELPPSPPLLGPPVIEEYPLIEEYEPEPKPEAEPEPPPRNEPEPENQEIPPLVDDILPVIENPASGTPSPEPGPISPLEIRRRRLLLSPEKQPTGTKPKIVRSLSPPPTTKIMTRILRPIIQRQIKEKEKFSRQLRRLSGQERWLEEQANNSTQPQVGSDTIPSAPPQEETEQEEPRGEKEKHPNSESPQISSDRRHFKQWIERTLHRSLPESKNERSPLPHRAVLARSLGITTSTKPPKIDKGDVTPLTTQINIRRRRLAMKFDNPSTAEVSADSEKQQLARIREGADVNQELDKLAEQIHTRMEKRRNQSSSEDEEQRQKEANYFKVAKSKIEDDVTRNHPHEEKRRRGRPRKQGVSSTAVKTGIAKTSAIYTKRVRPPLSPTRRRSLRLQVKSSEEEEISPPRKIERTSAARPSPKDEVDHSDNTEGSSSLSESDGRRE